jgi:hypothetical protein
MQKRSAFTSVLAALLLSSGTAAQTQQSVPVRVQPAAALDVVLFSAANAGKVLATTAPDGRGSFDIAEVANLGKLAVIEERCPDRTRLLLVAADTQAPNAQKCRRRTVGAFWWGQDKALNAQLTGAGMSTTVKTGLIAAGAGGVVGGVALVTGGDDGTKPPPGPGPGPNDPPNTGPNATSFNGTYTGNLTATTNTCDFAGAASIRGVLAVDSAGRGTWQKTHVNANVTFNFNVVLTVSSSTAASFQAATTLQVGTRIFNVSDAAAIAGNVMTITQMLTNTSGQACTVRYTGQLTKS